MVNYGRPLRAIMDPYGESRVLFFIRIYSIVLPKYLSIMERAKGAFKRDFDATQHISAFTKEL